MVRRRPDPEQPGKPWVTWIDDGRSFLLGDPPAPVGRFESMGAAVTRGCTALRFIAAGIPWRAEQ